MAIKQASCYIAMLSTICTQFVIIIINLFIERHIQQAVRGALQHSIAALGVIINIQVNYF